MCRWRRSRRNWESSENGKDERGRGRESFSGSGSSKWQIVARKRLPTPFWRLEVCVFAPISRNAYLHRSRLSSRNVANGGYRQVVRKGVRWYRLLDVLGFATVPARLLAACKPAQWRIRHRAVAGKTRLYYTSTKRRFWDRVFALPPLSQLEVSARTSPCLPNFRFVLTYDPIADIAAPIFRLVPGIGLT